MKTVGIGIALLGSNATPSSIRSEVEELSKWIPAGRHLCVIYDLSREWKRTVPVESIVTNALIGKPGDRDTSCAWGYAGNVVVRGCAAPAGTRQIRREKGVLLFRRRGPKAYERRHTSVDSSLMRISTMDVQHPAFTRDVANNVWHLRDTNLETSISNRLASLLAWSDESIVTVRNGQKMTAPVKPIDLNRSLIGVPRKIPHDWTIGGYQQGLFSA